MKSAIDPRIRRTKRAIHEAFYDLLVEKDLDEITIKEIAATAEINRKTFYNHYSGIHQLVSEIENELIDKLDATLNNRDLSSDLSNPLVFYGQLADIFLNDVNLHAHFKKFGFHTTLTRKIMETLKTSLFSVFSRKLDLDKATLKIAIEYWSAGLLAVFDLWYQDGSMESVAQINETVSILSSTGFLGLLRQGTSD